MSVVWTVPAGTYTGNQFSQTVALDQPNYRRVEIDIPCTGFHDPANTITYSAEFSTDGGQTFPPELQAFVAVSPGDPSYPDPVVLAAASGVPQGANYPTHCRMSMVINGTITFSSDATGTIS